MWLFPLTFLLLSSPFFLFFITFPYFFFFFFFLYFFIFFSSSHLPFTFNFVYPCKRKNPIQTVACIWHIYVYITNVFTWEISMKRTLQMFGTPQEWIPSNIQYFDCLLLRWHMCDGTVLLSRFFFLSFFLSVFFFFVNPCNTWNWFENNHWE